MVGPSRVGEVDGAVALVELGKEEGAKMDSTGSGDGLQGVGSLLLERGGVSAKNQLGSLGGETGKASNRKIFMVEVGVVSENLIGL